MYALRLPHNPIICPQMLPNDEGDNINGPSLIKVPDWVPNPLGRYYLYFAHHKGTYIRLAWADELTGPWTIHPGGVLHVDDTPCKGHIASPDVHVLKDQREIRLYYHGGCAEGGQSSAVARSADGLSFTSESQIIGPPYMRVFRHAGQWYAICMPGHLLRSNDGLGPFEEGPLVLSFAAEGRKLRHTAVLQQPGGIRVFYSRIGDNPEHIMYSDITLSDEWGAPPAAPPVSCCSRKKDTKARTCHRSRRCRAWPPAPCASFATRRSTRKATGTTCFTAWPERAVSQSPPLWHNNKRHPAAAGSIPCSIGQQAAKSAAIKEEKTA